MTRKDLTDKELIKLSKTPPMKKTYIREGKGFAIRIMPTGSITFIHIYTINGKRKEDNLGHYDHVSLADARRKHRANLDKLEDGNDPQEVLPIVDVVEPLTVDKLVEEYCAWRKQNLDDQSGTRTVEKDILPAWSGRIASSIRRVDAIKLIEAKAIEAGKPGQGRNILKNGSAMFNYALYRNHVEINPFFGVSAAVPAIANRSGSRELTDDEIKHLWESHVLPARIKIALLLILSTGQRPGEVAGMHTSEIDAEWWTIPWRRIKTRKIHQRDHRVYLSQFALRLIESLCHKDGYEGWLFPNATGEGPIHRSALSKEVHRETKGKGGAANRPAYLGLPSWHPHDLRRTFTSKMAKMKAPFECREKILNHAQKGMDATYNVYDYDEEKKEWLVKWGEYLENLVGDKPLDPAKEVFSIEEEMLKQLVWRYPLTKIAADYGVSETAVRKRCKKHGIERPPQGYWLKCCNTTTT